MGDRLEIPGAANFSNVNFIFVIGIPYKISVALVSHMLVGDCLNDTFLILYVISHPVPLSYRNQMIMVIIWSNIQIVCW